LELPPAAHTSRYGNPAFRPFHGKLRENAVPLLESLLPSTLRGSAVELAPYLIDSFGNSTRIDYGTGHETNFLTLMFCLAKIGVVGEEDIHSLVLWVFPRYVNLMRKIQTTYWLEPAGSHGCWGLDDYQFFPFMWGAAQLVEHPVIPPNGIHNEKLVNEYGEQFMYLQSIQFIKQVKKGPLWETSPMIHDISGVPTWSKINTGMLKMYQAEVLSKFPIMQHFLFGSIFDWRPPRPSIEASRVFDLATSPRATLLARASLSSQRSEQSL